MSMVAYKGYMAKIEPDLDDGILVGRVINTRDIIGFHGETIAEAVKSFHSVVKTSILMTAAGWGKIRTGKIAPQFYLNDTVAILRDA